MSKLENHLINSKECEKLVSEYDQSNYKEINRHRSPQKPDSKTYSIDLEILQDYLKLISSEMEKKGIQKKGVQISLGKYPEKSSDPKLNPEYLGYQTVFISPVDLNGSASKSKESAHEEAEDTSLAALPNLNYMNLCPPN